jgi:hypothetical protein
LGLGGHWKVGYPTLTRVTLENAAEEFQGWVEFETVDADGVSVVYETPCRLKPGETATVSLLTKHGRLQRPMFVRLRCFDGSLSTPQMVTPSERGIGLPVEQPWVVGLGSSLNLDQAAMKSTQGLLPTYSSSEIATTADLPTDPQGYAGVDLLVIAAGPFILTPDFPSAQQSAIVGWVRLGGDCLVCVGKDGEQLQAGHWLTALTGAVVVSVASGIDPGTLESYLASSSKLADLTCARFLSLDDALVEVALTDERRQKVPLVYRRAAGLGRVVVFAADLHLPPLRDWFDRPALLNKLFVDGLALPSMGANQPARGANFRGYDDLAGQVRGTLQEFPPVRAGSLPLITSIILAFLLLVGPVDYFIIARLWRRPLWTWWTLLGWTVVAGAAIGLIGQAWKPSQGLTNRLELLDVDMVTGVQRGQAFVHQYAGVSGAFDFAAQARPLKTATATSPTSTATLPTRVSWDGQPGPSLGGFASAIRSDFGFPSYRSSGGEMPSTSLQGVGIPTAGVKTLHVGWDARNASRSTDLPESSAEGFSVDPGSDLIQGRWTNPFDQDLLDGLLFYRGWLYRLPTRLPSGASFELSTQDLPKDLARYLQRRQISNNTDVGLPWDPTDTHDLPRLVEILTLHQAAGGRSYTGLFQRYRPELDLSRLLALQRIIILARLDRSLLEWSVARGGVPFPSADEQRATYLRLVLPVLDPL